MNKVENIEIVLTDKESIFNFKDISGIYCIKNIINNKKYIGSSKSIRSRVKKHISLLSRGKHENKHLSSSVYKNGLNNFTFYVLEVVQDIDKLFEREQYYLDLHRSYNKDAGYNMLYICNGGVALDNCREVSCFDINGIFLKTYLNTMNASLDLKINYELIRGCCRKLQKKTKDLVFFYSDDITAIKEFKTNPNAYIQSEHIGRKRVVAKTNLGKKYNIKDKNRVHTEKKYDYSIEVYDFKTRVFIKKYNSIRSCIEEINVSKHLLSKNFNKDIYTTGNYIFRLSKILKGTLPKNYHYRPLSPGLFIKCDKDLNMGIYTKIPILVGTILGKSHIIHDNELIRTETGGFLNHSTEPNCFIKRSDGDYYNLISSRDIEYGEEITVDYYKSDCGLNKICKN